jgi:CRP-like cAMP-binding protein
MRPEPQDLTERILYLRSIPVAASLSPPVLKSIAGALRPRTFPEGAALMREGEPIVAMHLLTSGSLSLARRGTALGQLRPPQSLGFLGIIAQADGAYDAVCDEETRTFELGADALLDLMEDQFELLHATLQYTAERLYYDMQELPAEALGSPVELDPVIPDRPLDFAERVWITRQYSGFKKANLNALASLCRQYEEMRFDAGAPLWSVGDRARQVFLLVRGTIACETASGKRFRYGPHTGVGGIDVVADKPRWYSATAETNVLGFRGNADAFVDLLEHDFSLASNFLSSLAGAVVALVARRAELGHEPLAQKRDVSQLGAVLVGA